jgi:hypothetical protein
MRLGPKAALILAVTFALGGVIGALGAGFFNQRRLGAHREAGSGFVELMERLIEPRDSAQAAELRPLLEAGDRRNMAIVDGARGALRRALDSLRAELIPHLDSVQLQRVDSFALQRSADGHGAPGLEAEGREPTPPGAPPPGAPPARDPRGRGPPR